MPITDAIVYSNVWEDPELNRLALNICPEDDVLSITSGGCNSLNLLVLGPGKVVSIDLNPAQNALLELKLAGIKMLEYEEFLELLGVEFVSERKKFHPEYRLTLYEKIRPLLPEYARSFWDKNRSSIYNGIIMCGKVEKFFRLYRNIHSLLYYFDPVDKIFFAPDIEIQRRLYDSIPMGRWHFLNWLFLNRTILSLVKGAHSFRFVEEKHFDRNLNRKVDYAMRNLDNKTNYFFQLILLGKFLNRKSVPPYLLEENFAILKKMSGRLHIRLAVMSDVLREFGENSFNKFNLSNIMEWMEDNEFNDLMRQVIALARPGSRLCFRYTLAKPRKLDEINSRILIEEADLATKLHRMDRSFMYESFHVYRIDTK